jgi:putative DNA primase/helicase
VTPETAEVAQPQPLKWWWQDHIPSGKLGLLDGDPGLAKSVIMTDLAASATTGRPLPDGSKPARIGGVVIWGAEDGYRDTILPRLMAAGADLSKVIVAHAADHGQAISLPRELSRLHEFIDAIEAVLLLFDPWEFYLDADIIKGREQRVALEPVIKLIAERDVVLLGTRHLNQQSGQKALYRGRGDITAIGVSRYGFIVGPDPKSEDPADLVMVPHKHNLAPKKRVHAVRYRVEEVDLPGFDFTAPRISWNGVSEATPDQAVGSEQAKPQTAREVMEEVILPRLQEGPLAAKEGYSLMASFGVKSSDMINRARTKLKVLTHKWGGFNGDFYWHLEGQTLADVEARARVTPLYKRSDRSDRSDASNSPMSPISPIVASREQVRDEGFEPDLEPDEIDFEI